MKKLAFLTRVDDRERMEFIQRRLTMKITDEQLEKLRALMIEIWDNNDGSNYPCPDLFGKDYCTFPDREWDGQYDVEPKEDDEIFRCNVSLMDYIVDYKGQKHDRFSIANGMVILDENGEQMNDFPGFTNF